MNIYLTANTSWYVYNFRKNTILELLKKYKVYVISPKDKYTDLLINMGVHHINISIDQGGTNPVKDFITFISFFRIFSLHSKLGCGVCLNFTPKNNIYATLAARLCGIKSINNVAGLGRLFINESISSKIATLLYRFSLRYSYKVFFQNEVDRNFFVENKIVCNSITARLPGSGVDLSRFSISTSNDDGIVRFLLVARMLYDKGIIYYIDAARHMKSIYGSEVEFNLLGFLDVNNPSAVKEEEMKRWVDEGIVNYLGVSDNVESEIAKVDCVVLPSFYREGVPKSLLEAGAMGKPIITTDNVGCRETVEHGVNGFLCEPKSTESLIAMLDKMISMSHVERLRMGAASRIKMERDFDEKIVISQYLNAIEKSQVVIGGQGESK